MPLNADTPVYPGDPKVQIEVAGQIDKDGYLDHLLSFGTHNGTHIDAPAHMVSDGKMLDAFNVDSFIGTGKLLDVRSGFKLSVLEVTDIQANDIILFYTGASDNYKSPDYYENHPVITDEFADYAVSNGVKMIGVDTGSVDNEPFSIHKKLLVNNILIIENLVNLNKLLGKKFKVIALPLNLEVEGSPARVIAEIE